MEKVGELLSLDDDDDLLKDADCTPRVRSVTKQTANKSASLRRPPFSLPPPTPLLKLLGVPEKGSILLSSVLSFWIDWAAVTERLVHHPEEAKIPVEQKYAPDVVIEGGREVVYKGARCKRVNDTPAFNFNETGHKRVFPLTLALNNTNHQNPITPCALEAFIKAFPDNITNPRSTHLHLLPSACLPEIRAVLLRYNPCICGEERTKTFQLMGYSASNREEFPMKTFVNNGMVYWNQERATNVDWSALEEHLREHPHEAKIACHLGLYPLELAVQFEDPPVPLSTVQLLLELAPEALQDSLALSYACTMKDPEVARAILKVHPDLAGLKCHPNDARYNEQQGFPLHAVAHFMKDCGADLASELLEAHPAAIWGRDFSYDETPLEIACKGSYYKRKLSTDFLRILLQAGHSYLFNVDDDKITKQQQQQLEELGQMRLKSEFAYWCPLTELARLWHEDDLCREWELHNLGLPTDFETSVERMRVDWDNYCLGLVAAGAYETKLPAENMWEYPLLQAAIMFAPRLWTVQTIVRFHCTDDDLIRPDPRGTTPLLAAIDRAIDGPRNPEDPDHRRAKFSCQALLALLLDQPVVASHASNENGGFRLHRALHKGLGLEDGVLQIATAFPRALSIPDPTTGLIPCLLAAVGEKARVETSFELMLRRPDLVAVHFAGESKLAGTKRKIND